MWIRLKVYLAKDRSRNPSLDRQLVKEIQRIDAAGKASRHLEIIFKINFKFQKYYFWKSITYLVFRFENRPAVKHTLKLEIDFCFSFLCKLF
jgi:hypothetical protein